MKAPAQHAKDRLRKRYGIRMSPLKAVAGHWNDSRSRARFRAQHAERKASKLNADIGLAKVGQPVKDVMGCEGGGGAENQAVVNARLKSGEQVAGLVDVARDFVGQQAKREADSAAHSLVVLFHACGVRIDAGNARAFVHEFASLVKKFSVGGATA